MHAPLQINSESGHPKHPQTPPLLVANWIRWLIRHLPPLGCQFDTPIVPIARCWRGHEQPNRARSLLKELPLLEPSQAGVRGIILVQNSAPKMSNLDEIQKKTSDSPVDSCIAEIFGDVVHHPTQQGFNAREPKLGEPNVEDALEESQ